jgi:hypothetical protein
MPVMLSMFPRVPARVGQGPDGEEALGVHGEGRRMLVVDACCGARAAARRRTVKSLHFRVKRILDWL